MPAPPLAMARLSSYPWRVTQSLIIQDDFFGKAKEMRRHYDGIFGDARAPSGERFIWDYWHVPGRYTHLRTPAYDFFPRGLYEKFHNDLVWWGRRTLGCHDVTPTWMSCYVDGCEQRLHADLPHGPWAFVFSLTPWSKRRFEGGETVLLRETMLDYWANIGAQRGLEEDGVLREVPPRFNRLLVFDPRIPHGVRRVEGVRDVRTGRLVVHGWFTNPRPFIEGPLPRRALKAEVAELANGFGSLFRKIGPVAGLLSASFAVSAAGTVSNVRLLSNSLRSLAGNPAEARAAANHVRSALLSTKFPRARGASRVTLPLVFASGEE